MVNPSNTSPLVSLTLLGGFTLRVGGREVASIPRKARALLAYLAMQDGKPVSRETISDLLWTDRGVEQARHSLRQTLLVLRRELRDAGEDLIRSEDGVLSFRPEAVATDVGRFRVLARSRERADLAEAAELYAGPLLARFQPVAADFDDWVDRTRGEIAEVSLDVLGRLADCCLAAGDAHSAVLTTERMLAVDPLREDVHRRLIEAYARVERRADAIRQYNTCVEMLRRELDVGPSAETEALIGRVRISNDARSADSVGTPDGNSTVVFARATGGPPWIAVLPFRAIGSDAMPEYFAAGLVEDIVALLATMREPIVVSSNSSQFYKNKPHNLPLIGSELGVRYIVSGSARQANNWIRISVELAEAATGAILWAQVYDTKDLMLFDAQDNIARQAVSTLIPHIHESEMRRLRGTHPSSMGAYDLLLQAKDVVFRLDRESFDNAGSLIQQAIALDPRYAAAHALLADWYALRIGQGWSMKPQADVHSSDAAAQQAIEYDGLNARALALHAHTRSFLHRDYDSAITLFDRMSSIAPNDANGWMWSSCTHAYIGDGTEAVKRAEKALRLSPKDSFIFRYYSSLCLAHYTAGSYDEASHWGEMAVRESPTYTSNLRFTIAALTASGKTAQAHHLGRRLLDLQPDFRIGPLREHHPYRDADRRNEIAGHLRSAGLSE